MFLHCFPNVFYTFTHCLHYDSGFAGFARAAIFLTTQHNTAYPRSQLIQGSVPEQYKVLHILLAVYTYDPPF